MTRICNVIVSWNRKDKTALERITYKDLCVCMSVYISIYSGQDTISKKNTKSVTNKPEQCLKQNQIMQYKNKVGMKIDVV